MATDKAIQKTKGLVVAANNPYEHGYPCPNVNAVYGPYASLNDAFQGCLNIFDSSSIIPQGTTVGVVTDGKVVEYWFANARPLNGYKVSDLSIKLQEVQSNRVKCSLSQYRALVRTGTVDLNTEYLIINIDVDDEAIEI